MLPSLFFTLRFLEPHLLLLTETRSVDRLRSQRLTLRLLSVLYLPLFFFFFLLLDIKLESHFLEQSLVLRSNFLFFLSGRNFLGALVNSVALRAVVFYYRWV